MLNFEQPMAVQSFHLADGDAGTNQTVRHMRRLIEEGKKDPVVRELAAKILTDAGVAPFDDMGEARAIGEAVGRNVRFTRDVYGKETLHAAREIIRLRVGDCDDFTILICSLLGSIGHHCAIVTVSSHEEDPTIFSHVYPETEISGQWIPVDFARRSPAFGKAPERYFRMRRYDCDSGEFKDVHGLNGLGAHARPRRWNPRGGAPMGNIPTALPGAYSAANLNLNRHLRARAPSGMGNYGLPAMLGLGRVRGMGDGDDIASEIATVLQAAAPDVTAATTGAANIIRAQNASLLPYAGAVPPGYSVNPLTGQLVSTSIFGTTSSSTLLLLAAAAIAAIVISRSGS